MTYHVRILAGRLDRDAGSHVYHQQLARRLSDRGHRVSVVCFSGADEVRDCATVYELPRPQHARRRLRWRFAAFTEWQTLTAAVRRVDLPPADVVIGGEHLFLKGHWQKFPRTPWVYLPHSLVVDREIDGCRLPPLMDWITRRVYRHLQHWALRRADRTLRFSRLGCAALDAAYGRSVRTRYCVNPAGVDLAPKARQPGNGEVRLLSVGRLIPGKGLDTALRALRDLRRFRWRYDIVGGGESRRELEEQVCRDGLAGRVHFHGPQRSPRDWYRRADLLLFPSVSESFGLVLVEAMSHGVPCLAMRPDGVRYCNVNPEIIDDGRTGLLADGEGGFARQLEAALGQPDRLKPMGRNARRHVSRHFTWDAHLDRYEQLFSELCDRRRSPRGPRRVLVGTS